MGVFAEHGQEIKDKLLDYYGIDYSLFMLADSTQQVRDLLDEETEERWLERELREKESRNSRIFPTKASTNGIIGNVDHIASGITFRWQYDYFIYSQPESVDRIASTQ